MNDAPQGWYRQADGSERYWNGSQWTDHQRVGARDVPATVKKGGFSPWMRYATVGVAGLVLGGMIGGGGSSEADAAAMAAQPTVTATATTTATTTATPTATTTITPAPSPVPTVTVTAKAATAVPKPKAKPKPKSKPKPQARSKPKPKPKPKPKKRSVYYKNCDAAKAAGAAPVYVGDPGYGRHLDRDGDGVGCEW